MPGITMAVVRTPFLFLLITSTMTRPRKKNRVPVPEMHRFSRLQTAVSASSFPIYSKDLCDHNYLGLLSSGRQYRPVSLLLKHFLFRFVHF
jgi:hypothetical protein